MSDFRADIHCHSTCSDGSLTPKQLVQMAVEIGLDGFSITDHDTTDAYYEALPEAKKHNLPMISGCEFSTVIEGVSVHLLGYAFDLHNEGLIAFCAGHRERRETRLHEIIQKLRTLGIDIDPSLIEGKGSLGRPHVAHALVKMGVCETVDEAFKKYVGDGKLAYVPGHPYGVRETIDVIHAAGGFAVIAHPHLIRQRHTVKKLLKLPFDGIEVFYAKIPADQERRWHQIAIDRKWLMTGGSDFHGDAKPHIPLGCSWCPQPSFEVLYERFSSHPQPAL